MSDINVRADAVDVEQIMRQIRARIREKRGTDYTEAELQQLAAVKLEKFLDPRGLRSDLVAQFKRQHIVQPKLATYEFGEATIYETHRGLLLKIRRWLNPILKMLFNPDPITLALHLQSKINLEAEKRLRRIEDRESLSYELLHNLTLEITRLGIEAHNLKMRVESLQSRLDFDERRSRSLESVVEYRPPSGGRPQAARPGGPPPNSRPQAPALTQGSAAPGSQGIPAAATAQAALGGETGSAAPQQASASATGDGSGRRRRRRRRRRPGATMAGAQGAPWPREGGGSQNEDAPGAANDGGGAGDGDGDDSSDSADATES